MMTNVNPRIRQLGQGVTGYIIIVALIGLAGCDRQAVSAPAMRAQGQAYELVTQHRPVSPAAYLAMGRAGYDMCVTVAKESHLPVKPFVMIPPDFVAQRDTMKSDGTSFYWKVQGYELNLGDIKPELGCATRIVETVTVERIGRGKMEHLGSGGVDGQAELTSVPDDTPPPDSGKTDDLALYLVAHIEKGMALKCLAPGNPALQAGLATEICIVDAGAGRTLRSSTGEALVALSRVTAVERLRGVVLIEPVSLRLGKVDPLVFSGALK